MKALDTISDYLSSISRAYIVEEESRLGGGSQGLMAVLYCMILEPAMWFRYSGRQPRQARQSRGHGV